MIKSILLIGFTIFLLIGCNSEKEYLNKDKTTVLKEIYQTQRDTADNIDSPAYWTDGSKTNYLLATAKSTDKIFVHDASNGKLIKTVGESGSGKLQFERPNGIFVIDSLLLIVERDNHRVQVLSLPDFNYVHSFGADVLIKPYGIWVYSDSKNNYKVYITDNYETADEKIPPLNELDKRVCLFNLNLNSEIISDSLIRKFGSTSGEGVLRVVESIWGDEYNNILLIAEEELKYSSIKIYDLAGNFSNTTIDGTNFKGQIEGISLYEEGKNGFWIITDQSHTANTFKIYNRNTFEYITEFIGKNTSNTDGIWLAANSFENFKNGAFFAVHDDGNVSAFDFTEILKLVNQKM